MGRIDRRIARLESTYQSGDEWPPGVLAAALTRLSDRDMELIEDYLYPEGLENAQDLLAVDWGRPLSDEQAEAFARLHELVGDVRDEWGV
jgi:hypothetical protein